MIGGRGPLGPFPSESSSSSSFLAILTHARPTPEDFSSLASTRDGFGSALLLLHFVKAGRFRYSLPKLDLSEFSLGAQKLRLLLSLLASNDVLSDPLETLKCGPHVCRGDRLPVLTRLLRTAGYRCGGRPAVFLKSLDLSKCELGDSEGGSLLHSLPPSLEVLNLQDNFLRSGAMETLSSALHAGSLSALLRLDVSRNPLGPPGVVALARGLGAVPGVLPLQRLELRATRALAEGIQALSDALKQKTTVNLESLDVGENHMRAEGVKGLASAAEADGVPRLRVLRLDSNRCTEDARSETDVSGLSKLLCSSKLSEIEELDLRASGSGPHAARVCAEAVASEHLPKLRSLKCSEKNSAFDRQALTTLVNAVAAGRTGPLHALDVSCDESEGEVEGEEGNAEASEALAHAVASCRDHLSQLTELKWQERSPCFSQSFVKLMQNLAGGAAPLLRLLEVVTHDDDDPDDDDDDLIVDNDPGGRADEGLHALAEGLSEGKLSGLEGLSLDCRSSHLSVSTLSALGGAVGSVSVPSLQKLELKWYDDGNDGLRGFSEGLGSGRLPCLRHLCLNVCCDEVEGCRAFGRVLSTQSDRFPSLRVLQLEWDHDNALLCLCEGISEGSLPQFLKVDLTLCEKEGAEERGDSSVSALAGVIRGGKIAGLQKLEFRSKPGLSRDVGRELGASLTHSQVCLSSLRELVFGEPIFMGGQAAQGEGFGSFLSALVEGPNTLPALEMVINQYHFNQLCRICLDEAGCQAVAKGITEKKFPSLKKLHLDCRDVGPVGVQVLGVALSSPHASTLRSLSIELGFNLPGAPAAPGEVGMFSMALASGSLSGLHELFVETNFDIEGVRALCTGLSSFKLSSLRSLNFSFFHLDPEKVRELAQVLDAEKLPCLQDLNLSRHPQFPIPALGNEGLRILSDAWLQRTPPPLEKLGLRRAGLTDESAPSLMALLGSGRLRFLAAVDLAGNEFSDPIWEMLKAAFVCVRESKR